MMSDDDINRGKWNKYVDIGNRIHKMRGIHRVLEAKRALGLATQLIDNKFIFDLPIKDQDLYETVLYKIAEYVDGNIQVMKSAAREYFLIRHCKASLDENDFNVSYSPKTCGIHSGLICQVSDGAQTTRYYIKTHQHGPTEDNSKSVHPPDAKEMFIYKLLEHIGIGPQVHFMVPYNSSNKKTLYIATKDCHLVLLSDLTKDSLNTKALVQLDLISRILLYLGDCPNNPSNCGQVDDDKPMIVDFRIISQAGGYVTANIVKEFCKEHEEFYYQSRWMARAFGTPKEDKLRILRESLEAWNLLENIDKALLEMRPLIQKLALKSKDEDGLQRYAQDVKATIGLLLAQV